MNQLVEQTFNNYPNVNTLWSDGLQVYLTRKNALCEKIERQQFFKKKKNGIK